ncbi:hypothetical protein B0H17DRAFT_1284817 [Mycena rosella]|uniref:Uncharacterized protein n=1 Tax=Mycena rosella TaxID=1033263 RepID=A0AAD7BSI8_MYCRO|nr:hypothetical protein B0H17DRAFT_1284817 [Mycena rosella]
MPSVMIRVARNLDNEKSRHGFVQQKSVHVVNRKYAETGIGLATEHCSSGKEAATGSGAVIPKAGRYHLARGGSEDQSLAGALRVRACTSKALTLDALWTQCQDSSGATNLHAGATWVCGASLRRPSAVIFVFVWGSSATFNDEIIIPMLPLPLSPFDGASVQTIHFERPAPAIILSAHTSCMRLKPRKRPVNRTRGAKGMADELSSRTSLRAILGCVCDQELNPQDKFIPFLRWCLELQTILATTHINTLRAAVLDVRAGVDSIIYTAPFIAPWNPLTSVGIGHWTASQAHSGVLSEALAPDFQMCTPSAKPGLDTVSLYSTTHSAFMGLHEFQATAFKNICGFDLADIDT